MYADNSIVVYGCDEVGKLMTGLHMTIYNNNYVSRLRIAGAEYILHRRTIDMPFGIIKKKWSSTSK